MDQNVTKQVIAALLHEVQKRLRESMEIAAAAAACVFAGAPNKGIELSMDIEQLIYEAGRLQDAISLLWRSAHLNRSGLDIILRDGSLLQKACAGGRLPIH